MAANNFDLNYNFSNILAMDIAVDAVQEYIEEHDEFGEDVTVKDMIKNINENFYDGLTRGDKCRVGRGISTLVNKGKIPFIERGEMKGSTNTYHVTD